MIFFKLAQLFINPSVFILILLLSGFLLLYTDRLKKFAKILLAAGIFFYYFLSTSFGSFILFYPLQLPYEALSYSGTNRIKTAIILTGGLRSDTFRALQAFYLYRKWKNEHKHLSIIIAGVNPYDPTDPEPTEVKNILMEWGVSSSDLALEDKSRTTWENGEDAKKWLGTRPFFLITSAYHMKRSVETFRALGMHPIPAAGDFRSMKVSILGLFPSTENFDLCDIAFHEYAGLLYYRLAHRNRFASSGNAHAAGP